VNYIKCSKKNDGKKNKFSVATKSFKNLGNQSNSKKEKNLLQLWAIKSTTSACFERNKSKKILVMSRIQKIEI
jgi:hypothetical protein